MKYCKINDRGVVIQVQPNDGEEFYKCDDDVVCGMEYDGTSYTNPSTQIDQLMIQKLNEARLYLAETDHKFYGDYESKEGEDLEAVRLKRKEARNFIRENS